jgi:hypothetical protein
MLVFIDDSGDPGFKLSKGSSYVFVLALVIFDDELEAEKTAVALKQLRRELNFPDTVEFKFNKSSAMVKRKFLQACSNYNLKIRAIVVQKSEVYSSFLVSNTENFFNYFVMSVLKHNDGKIKDARLKFDKRGEKRIRDELRVYLSNSLDNKTKHIFKKLDFVDSKQNILIQLADMVAGTIASSYKNGDKELLPIISKQVEDIWSFK